MASVKPRTLREWFTQGCPNDPGRYCVPEIIEWGRENKWAAIVGDEAELAGGDSPALERYRDEKAKLAKLDRLQREGELIRRDEIHDTLMSIAALFRGCGDQLRRQFGNDALLILTEAIDEAERLIGSLNGDDE